MDFKTVLLLISAIVMGFVIFTEAGCSHSKTDENDTESGGSIYVQVANSEHNPLKAIQKHTTFTSKHGEPMTIECLKGESLPKSELNLWVKNLLEEHTKLWSDEYNYLKIDADFRLMACLKPKSYLLIVRSSSRQPVAFTHFRYEMDPSKKYEILFISDLIIEKSMSTHGIHHYIIDTINEIAEYFCMRKIKVAIFDKDKASIAQYTSCGFTVDNTAGTQPNFEVYSKLIPIQEQELD